MPPSTLGAAGAPARRRRDRRHAGGGVRVGRGLCTVAPGQGAAVLHLDQAQAVVLRRGPSGRTGDRGEIVARGRGHRLGNLRAARRRQRAVGPSVGMRADGRGLAALSPHGHWGNGAPRGSAAARHRARAGTGRIIARRDARLTPPGRLSAAASPAAAGLAAAQLRLGHARAAAHDGRCSWRRASRAAAIAPQTPAEASTDSPLGQRPCTSSPRPGAGRACLDSGAQAQAGVEEAPKCVGRSSRWHVCEQIVLT